MDEIGKLVADEPLHLMDGVLPGGVDLHVFQEGDPVSSYLKRGMIWHPPVVRVLAHLMKPDCVFVDVGAHIGLFSITAAKAAGETCRVVSFEPDAVNREILRRNARLNGVALDIRDCAIAGEAGEATLYTSTENRAIHSIVPEPRLQPATVVATSTLERELSGLDRIDLMKLDVQGAEPEIIDSVGDFFFRFERAPVIIMEVNPGGWMRRDPEMRGLRAFLSRYRYDVHLLAASEGVNLVPPPVRWSTFQALCRDLIQNGNGMDDLDVVLWPPSRHQHSQA